MDKKNPKGGSKRSSGSKPVEKKEIIVSEKPISIKCKNPEQKDFIKMIDDNEIVLCNGPAGCGKSFLSIIKALNYLREDSPYKKIIIITPTVEVSRNGVGFLKGTLEEKLSVYFNSIYRLFDKVIDERQRLFFVENGIIEPLSLSYIRGDNFDNCIVIVDEAQNTNKKEMLTILTRIGENCKMIISGDLRQIDGLQKVEESGLYHAMGKLTGIPGISSFTFSNDSIVRHGLIKYIIEKF